MKCYPIIRGCGFAKVALGVVLVGVAVWIVSNPWSLECSQLPVTCPDSAMDMLKAINVNANDSMLETAEGAEVQQFCDCFTRCVNYMTVFEDVKSDESPDNCFIYTQAMGIPLDPVNKRRLSERTYEFVIDGLQKHVLRSHVQSRRLGDGGSLPDIDKYTCASCEDLEGVEEVLFNWLAGLAATCGIALIITAVCEFAELKMHSAFFNTCIIITDIAAAAVLLTGVTVAGIAASAASVACDPEASERPLEDAGSDSTNGNEDAAATLTMFLTKLLVPVVDGVCKSRPALSIYAMTALTGHIAMVVSTVATLCVCFRCSDDGMDATYDDMRAAEMHSFHSDGYH